MRVEPMHSLYTMVIFNFSNYGLEVLVPSLHKTKKWRQVEKNFISLPAQCPCFQRNAPQEESDYCHRRGRRCLCFLHTRCSRAAVCPGRGSPRSPHSPCFLCPLVLQALEPRSISSCQQPAGIHCWCESLSPEDRSLYSSPLMPRTSLAFSLIFSLLQTSGECCKMQ